MLDGQLTHEHRKVGRDSDASDLHIFVIFGGLIGNVFQNYCKITKMRADFFSFGVRHGSSHFFSFTVEFAVTIGAY